MNIEDFEPFDPNFGEIFERQKNLKFKFEPESKEYFADFDIDTLESQEIFKTYCWRIVEELSEARETHDKNHLHEELIDGFNFLVELYLLCGLSYRHVKTEVQTTIGNLDEKILKLITDLGLTANLLKNRKWRRSQYLVDQKIFKKRLLSLWPNYIDLLGTAGLDIKEIQKLWSLKHQVNLFRIETNY